MLLVFGIVALLAIATSWLSRKSEAPVSRTTAAQNLPDYFINDVDTTVTDEQGLPSHELRASSLVHYPNNDTTKLVQPDITILNTDKGSRWHASAREGEIAGQQQLIRLSGDVRLKQQGENVLELQTERLSIDNRRRYAETDAPVTLLSNGSQMHGIGMKAYGDQQRILLLSSVRGEYADH